METRSQSKRRRQQQQQQQKQNPQNSSQPPQNNHHRNWTDLPTDLLLLILHHLSLSIPDLLSFAAVCRPWRHAASISSSAVPPSHRPPLLLKPKISIHCGCYRWIGPPKCHFKTVAQDNKKLYNSALRSDVLTKRCIGSSYGCMIIELGGRRVMVADVFNGREVVSPEFPRKFSICNKFEVGVMMGKLGSEDCRVVVVGLGGMLCWKVGSREWVRELYLRYGQEVGALVVFEGLVYCIDNSHHVKVVEIDNVVTWKTLELKFLDGTRPEASFGKFLVECGGRILLVVFTWVGMHKFKILVYRLDFEFVMWVKLENLGDWCLFIDVVGDCPIACEKPGNWGGRKNCVYFVGPGNDTWSIFPLDGSEINLNVRKPAISVSSTKLPKWPSPIWVHPSKLLQQGNLNVEGIL